MSSRYGPILGRLWGERFALDCIMEAQEETANPSIELILAIAIGKLVSITSFNDGTADRNDL